jgi:hypothetical protein
MSTAFVLGNGVSRKDIGVATLAQCGRIYGCNALYREHTPDVLVSTDRPIAEHIQKSGYSAQHEFYTRRPLPNTGAQMVPQKYRGFSSGPIAASIACEDLHRKIYLLGFDMGPTVVGKFNNVYAGTEFYKPADANPTYTGNWIRQLSTVIRDFPSVEFVRVCGATTADIPDFQPLTNLKNMSIDEFALRINTSKDL